MYIYTYIYMHFYSGVMQKLQFDSSTIEFYFNSLALKLNRLERICIGWVRFPYTSPAPWALEARKEGCKVQGQLPDVSFF